MSFPEAKKLVFSCLDVTRNMNKLQKSEYQHALITSCVGGFRQESGYRVGVDHDNQLNDVCKICFCHTYGISESAVDWVVASHKSGVKRPAAELNDRTAVNRITFRGMKRVASYYGFELSRADVAAEHFSVYFLLCLDGALFYAGWRWNAEFRADSLGRLQYVHCTEVWLVALLDAALLRQCQLAGTVWCISLHQARCSSWVD